MNSFEMVIRRCSLAAPGNLRNENSVVLATPAKVFSEPGASAALFHTGWFVESLATLMLVILVIRTYGAHWLNRPSRAWVAK